VMSMTECPIITLSGGGIKFNDNDGSSSISKWRLEVFHFFLRHRTEMGNDGMSMTASLAWMTLPSLVNN